MGTMLAQKKPLESIQRSQAINFVAEIFYDELQFILDRRLLDHTMVNCHGMNSRVKSRDVLSVSVQHIAATNADKEYILLNLARNSIYHQLPELLFHPLVLSTPGMSNKEIVEAIRANEKQDKELIQFFAPFDTEFFKEKVRINNRHLNFYNPQIQISAESETKRSIFREKDKTKRSKKESAQHSKSRNKSFVMTSVSAL